MTKAEGQIRINGVAVGEVVINLLSPTISLAAKYALCNISTGERFGMGNRNQNWSEETMTKLTELIQSLERDVIQDIFVDATLTSGNDAGLGTYENEGVPGL